MKIPNINKSEELTDYAEKLSKIFIEYSTSDNRKKKGQYYTPPAVSKYMASLFNIKGRNISLLDPGAGTGILSAAFCERILKNENKMQIHIDTYENDRTLIPLLSKVLLSSKKALESEGHEMSFSIFQNDFILHAADLTNKYNYVVSNPPYYKINQNTSQSKKLTHIINGQPNIYTHFMACSAILLKKNGQLVILSPRSYCSGLYFKKFRMWFFSEIKPGYIHLYHSRKDLFKKDDVLQENIILVGKKTSDTPESVRIGISNGNGGLEEQVIVRKTGYKNIIIKQNDDVLLRIPKTETDEKIAFEIDKFNNNLFKLGFKVSTGPVVPFRAKNYLSMKEKKDCVPLIWMQNIIDGRVQWPIEIKNKAPFIIKCENTLGIITPKDNYVFLKRFSSKERKQRISAGMFIKSSLNFNYIGIENHVNYIYRKEGKMTLDEVYGITTILNSWLYNKYFQIASGNTQVNASELNMLPMPSVDIIKRVGHIIRNSNYDCQHIEETIFQELGISGEIKTQFLLENVKESLYA